ncbi:MAG: ABC transporter permease [Planctomycetota bacterium]|nr:ABC transporter permease [Planctomycetota bacterium]
MVLEKQIVSLYDWLFLTLQGPGALLLFLFAAAGLTIASVFVAYLRCAVLYGPGEGFYAVAKAIATAVSVDLPQFSFRRLWAMARLTIQEALRRWVLAVFVLFTVILFFAGWFLDTQSDHPVRVYLNFVLTGTELLTLIMAVVLCTFSIPNDIKYKTIYTIVTKPVRASEIVCGRILGFALINTFILVMMCVVSYGFVVRGLNHRHGIVAEAAEEIPPKGQEAGGWKGRTSADSFHRHEFIVHADDVGQTDFKMDHQHTVHRVGKGEFEVGPPEGALTAKVPIYGKIRFTDRTGREGKGISVGKEWTYRQYIEGGSLAAAVWTFRGLTAEQFPEFLPLEMNIGVFRTYKGDIVSGIGGTITLKNPTTGLSSESRPFTAEEYVVARQQIPRKLKAIAKDGTLMDVDLFDKLADEEGSVEIWIQCSERSQYFGMAQPDLYIRGQDGWFTWNFVKAYVGIWLQMLILTCFGVMFSTFLSGSVAMFATVIVYMVGLFKEFIVGVATGTEPGGGPLEALLRIVTQKNLQIELDMGRVVDWTVWAVDGVIMYFVWVAAKIFPDYSDFNTSKFVAYGYNIDGNLLTQHCLITLVFVLVLSVYGYFFLKSREIAG